MSNSDDFNAKLADAKAVPAYEILKPYMPMGIFLQEAEDLAVWAKDDAPELAKASLDESIITDLPILVGATSQAQSAWMKETKTREQAEQEWTELEPKAIALRNELQRAFRYAFRHQPDLLSQVTTIEDGYGHADLIQDLNDQAVLGRDHLDALAQIGTAEERIELAATMSDHARDVRARANGEKISDNENLTIRNQMYTLLKRSVDEIRLCGKYVFWNNKDRLKGYSSAYNRTRHRKSKSSSNDDSLN